MPTSTNPLADTWFENVPMGQRARIVTLPSETGGRSFVLEYVNRPFAGEFALPAHFHPAWTETFDILEGHARCRIGGKEREVARGESVVMPPHAVHVHPWSASDEPLRVRHTAVADPLDARGLTAALQTILTIFWLASQGRVNRRGSPNPLQLAVLAETTMPATFVPGPPMAVQRMVIRMLAAVGRAVGYRTVYPGGGVVPE